MEELDKFKNIKDKVSFDPVHSTREKDLWEALEQRIHTYEASQKKKSKMRHFLYYAAAACVLLSISLGYYFTNIPEKSEVVHIPANPTTPTKQGDMQPKTSLATQQTQDVDKPVNTVQKVEDPSKQVARFTITPATQTLNAPTTQYLALSDRSVIALDAQSSIFQQKDFNTQRDLKLDGRAYFEVTHDRDHPFTVYFGNTHLVVLGTKFYVDASKPNSHTVTVIEGSVKVYDIVKKQYTVLTKNQELEMQNGQHVQVHTPHVQLGDWKKNALKFDDIQLSEVFFTMSKAFGKEINYASDLASCRFSGNLSNLSLAEALNFIKLTTQIQIEDKNDHVHIAGKGCH